MASRVEDPIEPRLAGLLRMSARRPTRGSIRKGKRGGRARCRVKGLDGGADFADGHQRDPERVAKVPAKQVGRMLTLPQAERLLERLER
jgi:hypothetical protein